MVALAGPLGHTDVNAVAASVVAALGHGGQTSRWERVPEPTQSLKTTLLVPARRQIYRTVQIGWLDSQWLGTQLSVWEGVCFAVRTVMDRFRHARHKAVAAVVVVGCSPKWRNSTQTFVGHIENRSLIAIVKFVADPRVDSVG